ncbi:MAG: UpxY family transcription antiterminator [Candidatus Neomarinimicrobiota bacterium]
MEKWIAVRSKPRAEKVAFEQLTNKGIEAYLPLIKEKRKWSDRMKWVEIPLFSSYLFARIELKNSIYILQTRGVSTIIRFHGKIAVIENQVMKTIKMAIEGGIEFGAADYFSVGDTVEVLGGPLKGVVGQVSKMQGENKMIIKIDALQQAISLHIDKKYMKLVKGNGPPPI